MKKKKIVTIGGGTGQVPLISGLKEYPYEITAIVTMADDGGSTGKLRDELGVLPPGDAMKCLVALSEAPNMLRTLMNYRFEEGGLKGHSFGNLFISALEKVNGSFSSGMHEAARILRVRGQVLPSSEDDMRLQIFLKNGDVLNGETHLDEHRDIAKHGIDHIALAKPARAHKASVEAIMEADYVIIGPGDLYGSHLPNFLVSGIAKAVKKTRAKCIFIAPLTNKKGHSENFSIDQYVHILEQFIGKSRIDYVILNTKRPQKEILERYEKKEGKNSFVSRIDTDSDRQYKVLTGDFLSRQKHTQKKGDALAQTRAFIRHDAVKIGKAVSYLAEYGGKDPFDII